ncbi:heterodimeric methylmalonyl-CoA mutase small subunit [Formosa sp. Hel1_31_208]|uniref:methylmalonyl-CoA mutase subunit beta n=1 Tax=Formosa sp. Hel1_31_208 TaxID=1798225 RepID=UPI00087D6200|nr:methylmalonyl-CoA mutase subunit beta [Formosa sp. Hel1_31_208]SDS32253.1 heterodimeric methylmalonyl-CoA mutase small subunit [Formosa sp. Hel1_31_208]
MSKQLFSDFSEVSSKQWKQKIQADLKGADYNATLIWHTNEGIDVKPFYHKDEFDQPLRTSRSKATAFKICQSIFVANTEKSNVKSLDAINRGAEAINFIIPSADVSVTELLKGIDLTSTPVSFTLKFLSLEFLKTIPSHNNLMLDIDIIGHLAKTGNWYHNLNEDHKLFESIVNQTNTFTVHSSLYQNAGANMVQQLAYSLAHLNEYFNHFEMILSDTQKQTTQIIFNVSVGTNYFFEIAKLKALRILYTTLANAYNFNNKCHINVTPSRRNKTIYDYNTNMLRTTTECMSAVLGGANWVTNLAYDAVYHKDNEFGERISRNQLLILKNESYFDKVDNPADGAYYIESLTTQLSEKALELFKTIEANGGFLSQLKDGAIQKKIKENALKEQTQFNTGDHVLLGTNTYPNPQDKMKDELELYPFIKHNPVKTLIEPIIEKRLAEALEQERLKTE